MTRLILLVLLVAVLPAWAEEPLPKFELTPTAPYRAQRSDPVNYDVDYRVTITAPSGTKQLKVWVPIPQDDLGQKVEAGEFSVFPAEVKPTFHSEKVFGNRFAYFEFDAPQGAQIISHRFKATVWELRWDVDPKQVTKVEKWPASFEPYRRTEKAVIVDPRFTKLANEIAAGRKGTISELDAVMDWVQDNMTYDHSNTSLIASSEHALSKKRGDCSDYHGLCSSLGRALGVPTRVTYGLHLFPKNLPCHCKLEAFLPPYGWVSFDVSETQRLVQAIRADRKLDEETTTKLVKAAIERLRHGFRDNTWLLQTKGTDFELVPPASQKVPLIASIYAEADGKPLPFPDPADPTKREFSWMTSHKYQADRAVKYPFRNWDSLIITEKK